MRARLQASMIVFAPFAVAALVTLLFAAGVAAQEDAPLLHPGETGVGRIDSSSADSWRLIVCAEDVVTVTLASAAFTPYLEVSDADDALVTSVVAAENSPAVAVLTPLTTTTYALLTGGDRRSARGAYTLTMTTANFAAQQAGALGAVGAIAPGVVVTGVVARQAGESWLLYACAGAPLTLTVTSQAVTSTTFTPYLELIRPADATVLAEVEGDAAGAATIAGFAPETTGLLLVVVTGVTSRDRGAYALAVAPLVGEGAAVAATATATSTPRPTATPTVRATPTPLALACTVQTNGLNMRSGPGIVYDPPLRALNAGTTVRALARDAAADWLQVEVLPARTPGWIAARYINCIGNVQSLPVGQTPPTPPPTTTPRQPTAAPTFTPTRTPTPPALVVIPGGGPSGNGWNAAITTAPGLSENRDGVALFRNGIYIRLEIYSTPDNQRVRQVRFTITDDATGEPVHVQTEESAGYCSFGGGDPCNTLRLDRTARWPSSGTPIRNGFYAVNMEVTLANGVRNNWFAQIQVESPDLAGAAISELPLFAAITETGPGSNSDVVEGALAFRVDAHDPAVGVNGGDGIDFVNMWVYGPDGREVRFRREGTSGYCIFQNGEPTCNVWVFAEHDNRWPEGEPFVPGRHTLRADVHTRDGRVELLERVIELQ